MSTDLFKFSFTQRSGVEATKGSQSFFAGQGQMSKVTACLSEEQCALPPQQMTQNTAAWSPACAACHFLWSCAVSPRQVMCRGLAASFPRSRDHC